MHKTIGGKTEHLAPILFIWPNCNKFQNPEEKYFFLLKDRNGLKIRCLKHLASEKNLKVYNKNLLSYFTKNKLGQALPVEKNFHFFLNI